MLSAVSERAVRFCSGCDHVGGELAVFCRLSVGEQCRDDLVYLLLEVGLVQAGVLVEALSGAAEGAVGLEQVTCVTQEGGVCRSRGGPGSGRATSRTSGTSMPP
jgi:hypothetical protein